MREFGRRADDYRRYRAGFPESIYPRLEAFGIGRPGQRVVDLGTGTGTLARGLARRGCSVTGIDVDARMLEQARALDAAMGVKVDYRQASAEQTGLDAGGFDVAVAGQCWHWLDRPAAAREVARVLRPGGLLAIAHFDWIPVPGNVVEATEALILEHNPGWKMHGGTGQYPWWAGDLVGAGYRGLETFSYDVEVPYTHEAWRGRVRTCNGVGAGGMDEAAVARFDAALAELLRERFPAEPLCALHRVWALVAHAPGEA